MRFFHNSIVCACKTKLAVFVNLKLRISKHLFRQHNVITIFLKTKGRAREKKKANHLLLVDMQVTPHSTPNCQKKTKYIPSPLACINFYQKF